MINQMPLPYGILDLTTDFTAEPGPPFQVRCFVQGCQNMLRPPAKRFRGDLCSDHGIFCNFSGSNVTYTFQDPRRNLIASPELFAQKVRGNRHKTESHRFGFCNSEDTVSWNVFRSFQEAEALHLVAQLVLGRPVQHEPLLYLWGLSSSDDRFRPWPLLQKARQRFEIGKLPVVRPVSEPDIALFAPGEFIIFLEAKLLSQNPVVYQDQPRRTPQTLTLEEVLDLYADPALRIPDRDKAKEADRLYSQLYRYLVFADYMAYLDGLYTEAFLANLVRAGQEHESTQEFCQLLNPAFADRFVRITWETLYTVASLRGRDLSRLQEYMLTKAVGTRQGFVPAFQLDAW